ncbi:MAG: EamA family transporter [Ilumatobacteraceae bacterium]|nr:EamA family transporter [Ilumatobacteraceae bacterium]
MTRISPHDTPRNRTFEPEILFLLSAVALNSGNAIAKAQFDTANPAALAWLRMFGAMVVATAIAGPRKLRAKSWTRESLRAAAVFGLSTGLTSTFFYLAIDRLPLGKGVAIEFIGPITVAAVLTRSRRNAIALVCAIAGVAILSGVEIGDEPLGVLFILLAAASWAVHIVSGAKVARGHSGIDGLAMAFVFGTIFTIPFGLADADAVVSHLWLIPLGLAVGTLSSVTSYGIDQRILRKVTVRHYSVLLAMLPIVSSLFGYVVFDQTPTGWDLVGGIFIIAGIALQER